MRKILKKILSKIEKEMLETQIENLRIKHPNPLVDKVIQKMCEHRERTGIQ